MKKVFFVLVLLVTVSSIALGQERIKKILDLKNGSSVTGFVMEQADGSYMLETDDGDIVFYSRDEVRTVRDPGEIKKEEARTTTVVAKPQIDDLLKRSGFSLTFKNSHQDLQSNQVSSDFWNRYRKASAKKKSGMWLMITGGAIMTTGSALYLTMGPSSYEHSYTYGDTTYYDTYYYISDVGYVGMGLMAGGFVCTTWGFIRFLSGNARLGKLATKFNLGNGYASELSFDYNPTGFSLAYHF